MSHPQEKKLDSITVWNLSAVIEFSKNILNSAKSNINRFSRSTKEEEISVFIPHRRTPCTMGISPPLSKLLMVNTSGLSVSLGTSEGILNLVMSLFIMLQPPLSRECHSKLQYFYINNKWIQFSTCLPEELWAENVLSSFTSFSFTKFSQSNHQTHSNLCVFICC